MKKASPFQYQLGLPLLIPVLYLCLFAGLYGQSFSTMVAWWQRPDYSYCYLVPLIILYLVWEKSSSFKGLKSLPTALGLIPLGMGILLYWLGELGGEYYLLYLSSWLVLLAILLVYFGIEKTRIIAFPLGLILTLFPLPNFFNFKITLALKLASSKLGVMMIQAAGMSAFREGNVIDLGFTRLQVVDACSGLRYLYPMLVLSILAAYFHRSPFWKKLVIVGSAIPLTLFTNALRIALTGILSQRFGSAVVEGFFHDFEGWLIFMVTLAVLMAEIWIMDRLFPKPPPKKERPAKAFDPVPPAGFPSRLKEPGILISMTLMALTLILSRGVEFREAVPMKRGFDSFPSLIGNWEGTRKQMEAQFIEQLDFTDYIMMEFHDNQDKAIDFYVAYYESQRKGESIHSPSSCLRGGGWEFKASGRHLIPLSPGQLPVNLAHIQKQGQHQLSLYWFPSRGRNLTNAYEMKWFNFWDALTRQRTDGALVRIISHVYPDETPERTRKRLETFVREIYPLLSQYLPG